jgi:uncharacterized protein
MLGFSFSKILVLAIAVAAVWFGFRYFTGLGQAARERQAAGETSQRRARRPAALEAEEMTACSRCGTYVSAAKPSACSRADCPYRR